MLIMDNGKDTRWKEQNYESKKNLKTQRKGKFQVVADIDSGHNQTSGYKRTN